MTQLSGDAINKGQFIPKIALERFQNSNVKEATGTSRNSNTDEILSQTGKECVSVRMQKLFLQHGKEHDFKRGRVFLLRGDAVHSVFAVVSGGIKIFRETHEGDESVLDLITSGGMVPEVALYDEGYIAPFNARVVSPSAKVIELPVSILRDKIKEEAEFAEDVCRMMVYRAHGLRLHAERLTVMNAAQKITSFIMQHRPSGECAFRLPFDKALIARYLGMQPETFSRVQGELAEAGIVIRGSIVTIADPSYVIEQMPTAFMDADEVLL